MVFVPDVVSPGEDGCMGILEQMAAGQAEDNHYQAEGAEDIRKLEAVGKGNWVQGLNQPAWLFCSFLIPRCSEEHARMKPVINGHNA